MSLKNIKEIKVKSNPRKDFGNMKELTASIKEHGILEPLLITKGKELVAGERRLKAAKLLGLKQVPVTIINSKMVEEIKLVENLQRKDLNPIEEGEAFKKLIGKEILNKKEFSKKIGKTVEYVERRLALCDAKPEVKEALIKRKIELGHAAILSRMDDKNQVKTLKNIIKDNRSVQDIEYALEHDSTKELDNAAFDKKDCSGCKHNGSQQTLLIDSGDAVKGQCLNPTCFQTKTFQYVQKETKKLQEKGINVLTEKKLEKIEGAEEIRSYNTEEYKKALKNLDKKPDVYAVVLKQDHSGGVEKEIYQIKKEIEKVTVEKASKQLNLNRKEKLQMKVNDFKRTFWIDTSARLLEEGSRKAKAIIPLSCNFFVSF